MKETGAIPASYPGSVAEQLRRHGSFLSVTRGGSMEPLFRTNRDAVLLKTPSGPVRRYDVVLYCLGGKYILHRVIAVREDCYWIRGDATYVVERVPKGDVIGILVAFVRKGKHTDVRARAYRFYSRVWCAIYPVRYLLHAAKSLLRKACRCIFPKKPSAGSDGSVPNG